MAIIALVLVACPVILVLSNFEQVNEVTLGLAGASVMVAAARMAISLREQRALNDSQTPSGDQPTSSPGWATDVAFWTSSSRHWPRCPKGCPRQAASPSC